MDRGASPPSSLFFVAGMVPAGVMIEIGPVLQ